MAREGSVAMASNDGISWTGNFNPTGNIEEATNILTLANTYTDLAGNTGVTSTTANYSIDTKAPTVLSFTISDSALRRAS